MKVSHKLVTAAAIGTLALVACTPETPEGDEDATLSEVQVALVPGGAHQYFQPWAAAGQEAADEFELGGFTFNETAEWDQTKQNNAINALAAQGYNAFGVFGVSATDVNATFENLAGQGFAAAALGSCPAGDLNNALFCLSTDTETAAYIAAVATIEAMGGEGNLVHLTGQAVDTNTQRRINGVEQAVAETDGAVTLLTTVTDIDADLQSAQRALSDLLATQGDQIQGVVTSAGNPAVAVAQGVPASGLDIATIATDDDPIVLNAIEEGGIAGTVVQNPYAQAYIGTWALGQLQSGACVMNEPGIVVDSKSFVVTSENLETYEDDRMAATEEIMNLFKTEYLNCNG